MGQDAAPLASGYQAAAEARGIRARVRGQPVIAFGFLLAGWVAIRALMVLPSAPPPVFSRPSAQTPAPVKQMPSPYQARAGLVRLAGPPVPTAVVRSVRLPTWLRPAGVPTPPPPSAPVGGPILWLAATALIPLPDRPAPDLLTVRGSPIRGAAWSGEGWLVLRGLPASGLVRQPTYGASQLGATIRYRLRAGPGGGLLGYLRGSAALHSDERDLAAGLSIRPGDSLPFSVYAEARAVHSASGPQLRPGAGLVTALLPQSLPWDFIGEAYAQAGWVGGREPTGFAEGQLHIDRVFATGHGMQLRGGSGVWGAMQKGAGRLDIGPQASLSLAVHGSMIARIEADWRFRIAGNAIPDSGPAIVLATSF